MNKYKKSSHCFNCIAVMKLFLGWQLLVNIISLAKTFGKLFAKKAFFRQVFANNFQNKSFTWYTKACIAQRVQKFLVTQIKFTGSKPTVRVSLELFYKLFPKKPFFRKVFLLQMIHKTKVLFDWYTKLCIAIKNSFKITWFWQHYGPIYLQFPLSFK